MVEKSQWNQGASFAGELFCNEARSVASCVVSEKRRLAAPLGIHKGIIT